MLRLLLLARFLFINLYSISQIQISDAEIILQSRHIWRGNKLGDVVAIEPSFIISGGRFWFNLWAAVTPNNSYSEIDVIPSYRFVYFKSSYQAEFCYFCRRYSLLKK